MSQDNPEPSEIRQRELSKEGLLGSVSMGLYLWDMFRFFSHQGPADLSRFPPQLRTPYLTEGIPGFFDQHIGDMGPTLLLIYLSRIPVELGSKLFEAATSKSVDPRIKLHLAIVMGMVWPAVLEIQSNDPLDFFGIVVAGIVVSAGYETAEFLTGRPKNYWSDKFSKIQEKIKPVAQKLSRYF